MEPLHINHHAFYCLCVPLIQNFSVKTVCQHGISNLSDLLTVSVSYLLGDSTDDKKLDIVVKLLPHDAFGRFFVTINQFDLREIQFYTKVNRA